MTGRNAEASHIMRLEAQVKRERERERESRKHHSSPAAVTTLLLLSIHKGDVRRMTAEKSDNENRGHENKGLKDTYIPVIL